jgi:imidazolonepropionase-like amidohydrolase
LAAGSALGDTVIVTADRMVDVLAGRMVPRPQITITDGRISAVSTQGAPGDPNARHIDLPGMTLLPGLIDMHVHLTSDPRFSGYNELQFTDNFWTVVGVANAKRTLEAGFTTVRNVGSANFDDVALKQGIEQGYVPGPRIVPATYAIGATGGHCDYTEFPPSIKTPATAIADGPEALRAMVRKLRKYGAEVIKFCGTGGVLSKTDSAGAQQYSLEEMQAIVDEAHRRYTPTALPGSRTPSARASIRSNTRAWRTRRPSRSPSSTAPISTWTFTTMTTFSPRARRTGCSRNPWRRSGHWAAGSARRSAPRWPRASS